MDFLNSGIFQTAIIFLTGFVALFIYKWNKYTEKKDAARIIINEVRAAEKTIQEIINNKHISELSIILPNNAWQCKKHLFLNKLDEDDFNLINDFYNKCSFAEQYIKMIFNIENEAIFEKSNYLQRKLIDIMYEAQENNAYEEKKAKLIGMANNETWIFMANAPIVKIIEYLKNIKFITSSNAGD